MIKLPALEVPCKKLSFLLLAPLALLSSCGVVPTDQAQQPAVAPPSKLVVFGDSLSDQGNMFIMAREITHLRHLHMSFPPSSHQGGAFTNGKLPVEFVAAALGDTLLPAWQPAPEANNTLAATDDQPMMNPEILDMLAPTAISQIKFTALKAPLPSLASVQFSVQAKQKIAEKFMASNPAGLNYAVAGAAIADDYSGLRLELYNHVALDKQVNAYATRADKSLIANTVFIFFIGGNDLLNLFADKHFASDAAKRKKVSSLPALVVENIKRIQALGGRRILVVGPPDISTTPVMFHSAYASQAKALSQQLDSEMQAAVSSAFTGQDVLWLPLQPLFAQWLQEWPVSQRNSACVTDIEAGYYELAPLLERQELVVKFVNNCTQALLDQQQYPFFDSVHPSEKIYQLFAQKMLEKIQQFKAN